MRAGRLQSLPGSVGRSNGGDDGVVTIDALLLAAGYGTRLRPLTEILPKPALPLLDVPLGSWGLASLGELGRVAVNLSHLAGSARRTLEPYAPDDLVILEETPEPYGTAGTLKALEDDLAERFVTLNADLLTDLDAGELMAAHEASGAPATIAVKQVDAGADVTTEDGRVTSFIDRRERSDAPGHLFIGMAAFDRSVVDLIPEQRPAGLAETVLKPLAERGELAVLEAGSYAEDIGTPERYLTASLELLAGSAPAPERGWHGQVVEIEGGTAYLGPGTEVKPGCLGDGAIVLTGARVEGRVIRSIVWPDEVVPEDAEITDGIWFRGAPL